MRIDMEQFLAFTVALGTVGAVGVGIYSARSDEEPAPAAEVEQTIPEAEPEPAAPPKPVLVPIPVPTVAEPPAPPAAMGEEEADVPGPDVETPSW